jgi:hypothetical protein
LAGVVYQVMREGGVASVVVDQRDRGGTWQLLAVCAFQPGHGQGVSVAGGADGVVVADAIRFVGPTTSDLTTSSGTARSQGADASQQAVDSGHDPWRLDPLHVAHAEWGMLGFAETDPLELASQGPGVAVVHGVSRGARYQMRLVQPVRLGPTGIWTVESVYHLANL